MRGIVVEFDSTSGCGRVRAKCDQEYTFVRASIVKRSRVPRIEANVAFRQHDGKIKKLVVLSYRRQWEWVLEVLHALALLPLSLSQ